MKISERSTSKICHKCDLKDSVRVGSLFRYLKCGYSCNADYNGAMNTLKRVMG
ncbi:MAG: transposase [Candidatus Methanomethyliales bacterium]|nr:transposase [Candidatus Methanomethylicales archaeon]